MGEGGAYGVSGVIECDEFFCVASGDLNVLEGTGGGG